MKVIKSLDKQTKFISLATIICLIVAIILSVDTVKFYTQKKAVARATVSQMEMYDESTGDRNEQGYRVYVNYVCMGKTFHDIYYENVNLDTEIKVGDRIEIEVYEKNPEKIVKNVSVNSLFFIVAFIVLTVVSVKRIKVDVKRYKTEN